MLLRRTLSIIWAVIVLAIGCTFVVLLSMPVVHATVIVGFSIDTPWTTDERAYIIMVIFIQGIIGTVVIMKWLSKYADKLTARFPWLNPDDNIDSALLVLYLLGLISGMSYLCYYLAIQQAPPRKAGTLAIAACIASSIAVFSWVRERRKTPT